MRVHRANNARHTGENTMPAIAAGAVIGGSVISGMFGRSSAKKSIAFQREMAKNAHQYEVADLRKAGLNPILSGTGGPGARASGGAMPPTPDFANSARSAALIKKEMDLLEQQTRGHQYKADIDSPYALAGRLATRTAEAAIRGGNRVIQNNPMIQTPGASARAIKLQDDQYHGSRTSKIGFKKRATPRYNKSTYGN